jgi:alpha,alpha-trehalase
MNNFGYKCGWVKSAALACVLAAAGLSWGQAATLEEKATGSPAATEKYIHGAWDVLTRSMTECKTVVDPKLPSATVLYVPADLPVPPELAALVEKCHVDVEKLPRKVTHFGELKLTDIPHPGLLYLPNQYVVPGGRFNEMYGWDSYFILLGLVEDGKVELARGMVENFFYEIENYGGILNANRTYYFTRSQPPYLSSMIREIYEAKPDREWLGKAYEYAKKDHALWESDFHKAGNTGLARYYDIGEGPVPEMADDSSYYPDVIRYIEAHRGSGGEKYLVDGGEHPAGKEAAELKKSSCDVDTSKVCMKAWADGKRLTADFYKGDRAMRESGFDPSFRFGVFDGSTHHYAPVCLNALLYKYERDMEHFAEILGKPAEAKHWAAVAEARHKAVDKYLWDASVGMYMDYDFMTQSKSSYVYVTTFDPLWAKMATKQQAAAVMGNLGKLEQAHGLAMSLTNSGVQWDLPFGWAPTNWPSVVGMMNYGYDADARRISEKFTTMIDKNLAEIGTIREKYDVVTGAANSQITIGYKSNEIGFGWTNGVYLKMRSLLAGQAGAGKASPAGQ